MKENPTIVSVRLDQSNLVEAHRNKTQSSIPCCQLKMNRAKANAIIYSVMETATEHSLNVYKYLLIYSNTYQMLNF